MDAKKVAADAGGTAVGVLLLTKGMELIQKDFMSGVALLLTGLVVLALETIELDRL